jgi:hypothetical protein
MHLLKYLLEVKSKARETRMALSNHIDSKTDMELEAGEMNTANIDSNTN